MADPALRRRMGTDIEDRQPPWVRPYRAHDLAALYDVCVRTADAGEDARGKYLSDDLMPDIFVGPYVHLEPELAFVLDDGQRPVGYVVGTAHRGAPAVYLGVDPANTRARGFYRRLGFREIPVPNARDAVYMGRATR